MTRVFNSGAHWYIFYFGSISLSVLDQNGACLVLNFSLKIYIKSLDKRQLDLE